MKEKMEQHSDATLHEALCPFLQTHWRKKKVTSDKVTLQSP